MPSVFFVKVVPSHPCFTTVLHPQLSSHFSTCFPAFASGSSTPPSVDESIHCHPAGRDMLWPTLSQVLSPGLSSKSAANTLRPSHLREDAVSTRKLTISRPPWMRLKSATQQTLGRLTSPLFSQEREVSAIPFSASCSQTHSSMDKSRRDVEQLSSFGKPLSKSKRNRDLEIVQDSQMERGRILSEQRDLRGFPEKKADHAFQGENAQPRQDLSEAV